jgi:hypothetical protein
MRSKNTNHPPRVSPPALTIQGADGWRHGINDAQGFANIRFRLADERTHQAAHIQHERRPTRFVAERLGERRFSRPKQPPPLRSNV